MLARAAVVFAFAISVAAQDTTPCALYDVNTGEGVCNGINVTVGAVICAGGFNKSTCKASQTGGDGRIETYYFKGTPTGLPIGSSIQSDCSTGDFPANGNVAMAQTYQNSDGSPSGCYPSADIIGTTMTYTAGSTAGTLQSVTVFFNIHTDSGGAQRSGFISITCVKGGPTSNFVYTTVGDTGHSSQYEVDTTADCYASAPPATPAPTSSPEYVCNNATCEKLRPGPPGRGIPAGVCNNTCINPNSTYACVENACVLSSDPDRGVDWATCEKICGSEK